MSALRSSRTFAGVQLSDLRFKRNSVPVGGGLLSITESGEAVIGGPAVLSSLYVTGMATFGSTAVFLGSSIFTGPTEFGVTATFLNDIVAPSVHLTNVGSSSSDGVLTYDGSGLLLNGVEVGSGGNIVATSLDVTGSAVFQGSAVFTDMASFNGPSTFADTATFGGPASFGNAATFACPTLFADTATFLDDIVAPSVQLVDSSGGSVGALTYNGTELLLNGASIGSGIGGDIFAASLDVSDASVFHGTATFDDTATFASDIVAPSVQLTNGSSVGALTYDGSGLLLNGVEVGGGGSGGDIVADSLDVSGAAVFRGLSTFGSTAVFQGSAVLQGLSQLEGPAVFTDMAAFNGPSTFADTATFGGPASFGNAATFAYPTLFSVTATFLDDIVAPSVQLTNGSSVGTLTYDGSGLLLNGVEIGGGGSGGDIVAASLNVSGASVFQGLSTFGSTAVFQGSAVLQGTSQLEGPAVFTDMAAFNGPSTFADTATFGGPASFGNAATFACPTLFSDTATFTSDIVAPSVHLTNGSSVGALTYDGSGLLLNGEPVGTGGGEGPQGPQGPQGIDGSGSAIDWSTFQAISDIDVSGNSIVSSSGTVGIRASTINVGTTDSSTINIGPVNSSTINIGQGGGASMINIGSESLQTRVALQCGTAAFDITTAKVDITVPNGGIEMNAYGSINLDTTTGPVNITAPSVVISASTIDASAADVYGHNFYNVGGNYFMYEPAPSAKSYILYAEDNVVTLTNTGSGGELFNVDSSGNFTVPGTIRAGSSTLPTIDVIPGGPKTITVPTVNSIFNYTISAGGGGGGGSAASGGGGGGGGSGQIITGSIFCLADAITISYTLGNGGSGGIGTVGNNASNGENGQDSTLRINNDFAIIAQGGGGGLGGFNGNGGQGGIGYYGGGGAQGTSTNGVGGVGIIESGGGASGDGTGGGSGDDYGQGGAGANNPFPTAASSVYGNWMGGNGGGSGGSFATGSTLVLPIPGSLGGGGGGSCVDTNSSSFQNGGSGGNGFISYFFTFV